MFKLLKNFTKKETRSDAVNHVAMAFKSNAKIIEEIHAEFYSEVDKLLSEAKISVSEDTQYQGLIEKAKRLTKLGFKNTMECKLANEEIKRIEAQRQINKTKEHVCKAINYFTQKYPLYKFITEESVKKICGKYNLIYGDIGRYKGSVPDKNLRDMEKFVINQDDECFDFTERNQWYQEIVTGYTSGSDIERIKKAEAMKRDEALKFYGSHIGLYNLHSSRSKVVRKSSTEIVAPVSEFDTNGMELSDFKLTEIIIEDPIVLQPVCFEEQKHYLIVTAWGLEASDDLVVNQKMN